MKKILITLCLFPLLINAQVTISDAYLSGGHQFSNTSIPTNFINELKGNDILNLMFPQDSMPTFNNITGFNNLGIGAIIGLKQLPILGFDVSVNYQVPKEQIYSYKTYTEYYGASYDILDLTGSGGESQYIPYENTMYDTAFNYGFKIKNTSFGFAPQASILLKERFYFSLGFGVLANYITIYQSGYNMYMSNDIWSNSGYQHTANYWAWAMQAKAIAGIKIFKQHHIDFGTQYVSTQLNEIDPINEMFYNNSLEEKPIPVIPMYKNNESFNSQELTFTKLDLSGVNIFVRYRYSFGRE